MEEQLSALQMREDAVWELLEDPTLPPLDRQQLNEEVDELHNQIMELERRLLGFEVVYWTEEDDDLDSCDSQSIGLDEYDREGVIIYGQPDFM